MIQRIKIAILSPTNISFYSATGSLMYHLFEKFDDDQVIQVAKYRHDATEVGKFRNIVPFRDFLWKERNSGSKLVSLAAKLIRAACFFCKFYLGNKKEVLDRLRDFGPDLLYLRVVGDPYYYLTMALFLQKKLGVPLTLHFMDDFDLILRVSSRFDPVKRITSVFYRRKLREVLGVSSLNFAISESMKFAFEKRYGAGFLVAHNGIRKKERTFYLNAAIKKPADEFTLLWAGSIEAAKDNDILYRIARAIEKVNDQGVLVRPVRLLLNVPEMHLGKAEKMAGEFDFIRYQAYQPVGEYRRMLASVHLLLIGRDFNESSRAYTQYSFHNKLPDFLASGTPVLSIAPDWDNTLNIFRKYGLGNYLASQDPDEIARGLQDIFRNYERFLQKAGESAARAYDMFSMEKIRSDFEEALVRCIEVSEV